MLPRGAKRNEVALRSHRIVWIAWGVTLILTSLAPLARQLTGIRGTATWAVAADVLTMVVVCLATRRDRRAINLSIVSSSSALSLGAGVGFLILALLTSRDLVYGLAAKWLCGGVVLTCLMIFVLRLPASEDELQLTFPPSYLDKLKAEVGVSSDEELRAHIGSMTEEERSRIRLEFKSHLDRTIQDLEELNKNLKRKVLTGYILAVLGLVLLVVSFWIK